MRRSSGVDKRPHHGAVPLQAQPRPSTCTRPDRSNPLRRSYTFLTSPGHLGVPKHSPPSTTRKAGAKRTCTRNEVQQWQTTLHQYHPITFSYIKNERSVQISPVFEPNRRHNEPQGQKIWPFSCERASKKHANDRTRPVSTRDGQLDQQNEQKGYMDQPCAIFSTSWAVKGHF